MTETFFREHADLVTFRPWKRGGPFGEIIPEDGDDRGTTAPPVT